MTTAAIRHLHAFAREVNLTREEWFAGIMFLTQCGKISDDVRQEFILLSDTTGVSTLVEMLAYDASASSLTDNTVLYSFHAARELRIVPTASRCSRTPTTATVPLCAAPSPMSTATRGRCRPRLLAERQQHVLRRATAWHSEP